VSVRSFKRGKILVYVHSRHGGPACPVGSDQALTLRKDMGNQCVL
jgi:hypothetical protein